MSIVFQTLVRFGPDAPSPEYLLLQTAIRREQSCTEIRITPQERCHLGGRGILYEAIDGDYAFYLRIYRDAVSFRPDLSLPEPLRNKGLGTYLFARLVEQARLFAAPDVKVNPLTLAGPDNSELRDSFYEKLGFSVSVNGKGEGLAEVKGLFELRADWNRDKVAEVPLDELAALLSARIAEAGEKNKKLRAEMEEFVKASLVELYFRKRSLQRMQG